MERRQGHEDIVHESSGNGPCKCVCHRAALARGRFHLGVARVRVLPDAGAVPKGSGEGDRRMKRSTGLLLLIGGALVIGAVAPRLAYELEKGSWEGQVALADAIQKGKYIPPCD